MQRLKTRVIKKNCNPEWNDELTLSISNLDAPISLVSDIAVLLVCSNEKDC